VEAFFNRLIEGDGFHLWIDATHVKVRQNGRIASARSIKEGPVARRYFQ